MCSAISNEIQYDTSESKPLCRTMEKCGHGFKWLTLNLSKSIAGMWHVKVPINLPIHYTVFRCSLLSPCSVPNPSTFLFGQNSCRIPAKVWHCPAHCPSSQQRKATPCHSEHGACPRCLSMGPWLATFSHGKPCVDRQDQLFHWRWTRRLLFIRARDIFQTFNR